jgi:hypothetical protein
MSGYYPDTKVSHVWWNAAQFESETGREPILGKARLRDGTLGSFEVLLQARTVGANAPKASIAVERFAASK